MTAILIIITSIIITLAGIGAVRTVRKRNIHKHTHRLVNQELNYVWGMPGSGKSTLLAAVAQCCYENGIPCFSTFPIEHAYKWQGFETTYPVGSVFLLDEIYDMVGSGTNKGIPDTKVTMFFKLFRHSRYTIWACSQEVDDVARRVRGVVTAAWLIQCKGKKSTISPATIKEVKNEDGEKFELNCSLPLLRPFTDWHIYRPDFYSDFNSYSRTTYKLHAQFEAW